VNTKMPSDVEGSPSVRASGVCMKKPLEATAVTTLAAVSTNRPSNADAAPLPWIWKISLTGTPETARAGRVHSRAIARAHGNERWRKG